MREARRCFLHVGTHKTGTSALQRALSSNPGQLAQAGLMFPQAGRLTADSGHHAIAFELQGRRVQPDSIQRLLDEIAAHDHDVVLSSEEFTKALHLNPAGFSEFVQQLKTLCPRLVIVVYLRRQTGFLRSNYFERLKSGLALSFSRYVERRLDEDLDEYPLDYALMLASLAALPTGLKLRSYDALQGAGIIADFLGLIDPTGTLALREERVNTSDDLTESLKAFARNCSGGPLDQAHEFIIELITPSLAAAAPVMDGHLRDAVIARFDASNRRIAARFGLDALVEPPGRAASSSLALGALFSEALPLMIDSLADRFRRECLARESAQQLALERYAEIERLKARQDLAGSRLPAPAVQVSASMLTWSHLGQSVRSSQTV